MSLLLNYRARTSAQREKVYAAQLDAATLVLTQLVAVYRSMDAFLQPYRDINVHDNALNAVLSDLERLNALEPLLLATFPSALVASAARFQSHAAAMLMTADVDAVKVSEKHSSTPRMSWRQAFDNCSALMTYRKKRNGCWISLERAMMCAQK